MYICIHAGLERTRKTRIYVVLTAFMCMLGIMTAMVSVIRDPGGARALTSIATDPNQLSFAVKASARLVQFIIVGFHMHAHWLQVSSSVCYGMDLTNTMRHLHSKCFGTGNYLTYARQHRALDVLQANFTQLYPKFVLGMELFVVTIAVCNLYMAVEFHSVRALVMAVGCTVTFCWGMGEFAAVYETSKKTIDVWKGSEHVRKSLWFRKFLSSCNPIRVPLGSLFYIDRGFALTVLSIIIQCAASLILAK